MDIIVKKSACRAALCALALCSSSVVAGTIGMATVADVTLGAVKADELSYGNGINPQSQGPRGGSVVFGPAFAATGTGDWTRLAAFGSSASNGVNLSSTALGGHLSMSFDKINGRNGGWTVTNNDAAKDVELDLVFAIHTGGGSGAFLFDQQLIAAGQTLNGTWTLNLLNNGGQFSGYSNMTVFARNLTAMPVKVKEPAKESEPAKGKDPAVKQPAAVEPVKVEPAKVEPVKVEPAKVEPVKVEPVKVEPVKVEPAQVLPVLMNPIADASDVPEPATLGSMLLGLAMMGWMLRKRG